MKNLTQSAIIAVGLAIVIVAYSSLFIVQQGQQALVLRFGAVAYPDDPVVAPGLHLKKPFIEDVVYYDARVLDLDPPEDQVTLADQKRIVVDSYTRFKIVNPLLFYQKVRTQEAARAGLSKVVNDATRRALGNVMLPSVLSPEREAIMHGIQQQVAEFGKTVGVEVVDVRIRRADLPPETSRAIFSRMESERQREATEARSQGSERAQEIRAGAERERTVILAEATRQAQILRGQGDAEANRTYAEAYSADPQFFAFYRSLHAYQQALGDQNTTYLLSPDSDFFKFFAHPPERR